jgi:hypothetical protein
MYRVPLPALHRGHARRSVEREVPGLNMRRMTTVHFVPPKAITVPTDQKVRKNAIAALTCIVRDSALIQERLRELLSTDNRHGEFQVMRAATQRILENLTILIDCEEESA